MGVPRQHRSTAMEHGNSSAAAKRDGSEEFFEIDGVEPPCHHPEKGPVWSAQPVGQNGGPVASEMAAHRLQSHCQMRVGLERLEVVAFGDVEVRRRPAPRRVDQYAL